MKRNAPALVVSETGQLGSDNVVLNHNRAPFDNVTVRRAISQSPAGGFFSISSVTGT